MSGGCLYIVERKFNMTQPEDTNPLMASEAMSPLEISENLKFREPSSKEWHDLTPLSAVGSADQVNEEDEVKAEAKVDKAKEKLREILLSSLQMPNLIVLAGSGTSLGDNIRGPSMSDLWKDAMEINHADKIMETVKYNGNKYEENIEALLSQCQAHLQINEEDKEVRNFLDACEKVILNRCSNFIDKNKLDSHGTFLHRLSRRRVREPRLKLFTTNYDLCFECAASMRGIIANNGFSFTNPRHFDPKFFDYDIVRRVVERSNQNDYLEGVFHLLKLHGSVDWIRLDDGRIKEKENSDKGEPCMIYPAGGKYQQSYIQPHLEIFSRFTSSLRASNTCLLVIGFGFRDSHLSEPIISAVNTNPKFRLIIVNPNLEKKVESKNGADENWQYLGVLSERGEDVFLIDTSFEKFVETIPDLQALTPAQKLEKAVKGIK